MDYTTITIKIAIVLLILINARYLEKQIDARKYGRAAKIMAITALLIASYTL
ncbi:hypothetical protein WJ0W_005792 [Paenibacillus melissococcoides]|uniref:Uncharacterized protein n=1 Tax=Paenibacillus melissococcoides TaxID=2912268 RepID=A0ABN8UBU1_9BACL|nr:MULTISPECIES: hypothetical protein [Paenibacillus]MEB9896773.1 hypothetical protein [Bacillus cereus]CAH8248608.1 hypothetical protein WJ0W_005792 [Paenibacillus melissococcoides]CAH8714261.1 hypothetical protein WDD9_003820 [Paenibacillus melissococcoides]CAH8719971.1 hypothetical protein HTL2_005787 [Paenibacillus melissococcoides]GIO79562.1 hypothetical protein J6TS7_31720 [Paenibacillus dendritiformis]